MSLVPMKASSKMAIATPELLSAISDLGSIKEMKMALNVSSQCGVIAAFSTIMGGLIAGPAGITVGGLVGTALASYHSQGKFKSVPEILCKEATPVQKEKLADSVRSVLTSQNIFTIVEFIAATQSDQLLLDLIKKIVREFFLNDLGYSVC